MYWYFLPVAVVFVSKLWGFFFTYIYLYLLLIGGEGLVGPIKGGSSFQSVFLLNCLKPRHRHKRDIMFIAHFLGHTALFKNRSWQKGISSSLGLINWHFPAETPVTCFSLKRGDYEKAVLHDQPAAQRLPTPARMFAWGRAAFSGLHGFHGEIEVRHECGKR